MLESVSEYLVIEIRKAVGYPLANGVSFPKEVRIPNFQVKRTKSLICLHQM